MFRFGILEDLIADPRATLILLLLALPGRFLAISAHEAAHGWMANRCGDPTARMLGRVTLNPIKHLDPIGMLCMLLFGIGWAKPVPVNPRNFRHYRRDDFLVSIAGICMNIILFLLGTIAMYLVVAVTLSTLPVQDMRTATSPLFLSSYQGMPVLVDSQYYYPMADLMNYGVGLSEILIAPAFGRVAGYAYDMLAYFVMTNLVLAVFNLIPVPPLDGYHVLNDLVLKRSLFASGRMAGMGQAILYIALFSGVLTEALGKVYDFVLNGVGGIFYSIFRAFGLF